MQGKRHCASHHGHDAGTGNGSAGDKKRLRTTGLSDLDPVNLFRITWKNEPRESGGLFGQPNHMVLLPDLTGCRATIIVMVGKWFPTGAHKVGPAFMCLAPALTTGMFDPSATRAVWQDIQVLDSIGIDHTRELTHYDRKAIHHLKYFTWVDRLLRN